MPQVIRILMLESISCLPVLFSWTLTKFKSTHRLNLHNATNVVHRITLKIHSLQYWWTMGNVLKTVLLSSWADISFFTKLRDRTIALALPIHSHSIELQKSADNILKFNFQDPLNRKLSVRRIQQINAAKTLLPQKKKSYWEHYYFFLTLQYST